MNRGERIFGIVKKHIPGATLYGDCLAVGPTWLFLRGFRLLTTGRKNHNDLIGGMMPLWRPHEQPSLLFNKPYGGTIEHPQTGWIITDPRDHQRSAPIVFELIKPYVKTYEQIETVEEFLDHFGFMRPNRSPDIQLDFAIGDYLADDLEGFQRGLASVEKTLPDYYDNMKKKVRPVLDRIYAQLDADPAGLRDVIEGWRVENITRMGLSSV